MMKISDEITLPLDAATSKLAFFGENGAGKTYAAMKLAELFWAAGVQIIAFDPVGVWYGLRIANTGPGLSIVIFGGLHGDIEIEPHDGKKIAEIIVREHISAVIDVSQFETDYQKAQFASEFAQYFFFLKKANPGAVHLFLEEAQEFVAENPSGGAASKDTLMANRFQRIWKIGRNYGIGGSIISQRPQEISKKALNLSNAVFCFRLSGPHERKYMGDWLSSYGVRPDLPSIETGCPYLWSPSWLKFSDVVRILPKETADVSATPEVGAAPKSRTLTLMSIDRLRTALRADDPVVDETATLAKKSCAPKDAALICKLQTTIDQRDQQIEELTMRLAKLEARSPAIMDLDNEVAELRDRIRSFTDWMLRASSEEAPPIKVAQPSAKRSTEKITVEREISNESPASSLRDKDLQLIGILDQMRAIGIERVDRRVLAGLSGQSAKSSSYEGALRQMRTLKIIEVSGQDVSLGPNYLDVIDRGAAQTPLSLSLLHDSMKRFLTRAAGRCLDVIVANYPINLFRTDVAKFAGMSITSSSFDGALRELERYGLITRRDVVVYWTPLLFPNGLK